MFTTMLSVWLPVLMCVSLCCMNFHLCGSMKSGDWLSDTNMVLTKFTKKCINHLAM